MAFRKRNVPVNKASETSPGTNDSAKRSSPGIRPSFLTSQPTTSTGSASLDTLLGGHGGLAIGSSLLIGESGTTDFAGALLKYYAAEGICHGHVVHVVGVGEGWVRELPGVVEERGESGSGVGGTAKDKGVDEEKMKIAWRYERLGQAGERALPDRSQPTQSPDTPSKAPFCHTFDLTKRLSIPTDARVNHISISTSPKTNPFDAIIASMSNSIKSNPPTTIHRLIIPTILTPALYPPHASQPSHFLNFLHQLRYILRSHPAQLTALITLPLTLYPRTTALTRWAEILSDGVLELTPFPHLTHANTLAESGGARKEDEQPQGMLKVHKIPVNSERGEGGAGAGNSVGEDLAFTVSRRKFAVKPFSLPPVEGDQEGQEQAGAVTKKDVEF